MTCHNQFSKHVYLGTMIPRSTKTYCLFQLCLFHEAIVSGYETISGTFSQCVLCFACIYTVFACLIRRTPPPTFSDTAIPDRHSDSTFFQLRAHLVRISWSIGSEKSYGHVPPVEVELSTSCVNGEHPIH